MLANLFRNFRRERVVAELYGQIVAQARMADLYRTCGVPDTVEGRFELIALHAWLVMRRLEDGGARTKDFNQALFDYMFADMDVGMRELGAGDLGVGKRVKDLATHFYGRVKAYEAGLAASDPAALYDALDRNLFGSTLPTADQVAPMADYVRRSASVLRDWPLDRLLAGTVSFSPPPGVVAA